MCAALADPKGETGSSFFERMLTADIWLFLTIHQALMRVTCIVYALAARFKAAFHLESVQISQAIPREWNKETQLEIVGAKMAPDIQRSVSLMER